MAIDKITNSIIKDEGLIRLLKRDSDYISSIVIRTVKNEEYGLAGGEAHDKFIDFFKTMYKLDIGGDCVSLEELRQSNIEAKRGFTRAVDNFVRENRPEKYYMCMVDYYQQLLAEIIERNDVKDILRDKLTTLFTSDSDYIRFSDAVRHLNKEERDKMKKHFGTGIIDGKTIQSFEEKRIQLDACRDRFHKEILAFADKYLGKDETEVHVDLFTRSNILDDILADHPGSGFDQLIRDKEGEVKCRAIRTSGKGKLAVLIATFRIYHDHSGEGSWEICSGKEGYKDLVVSGPPWGIPLQYSKMQLEQYLKKRDSFFRTEYRSVMAGNTEKDDSKVIKKIVSRYPGYVSFSGYAPYFYNHDRNFFHRVIEFDFKKISECEKNPAGFLESMINSVKEEMNRQKR